MLHRNVISTLIQDDDDEDEDDIEETANQEGAEFGWFNDLFLLDTGKKNLLFFSP